MTRKLRTRRRPENCPKYVRGIITRGKEMNLKQEVTGRLASAVHRKRRPGRKRFACP